ncbi:MAG: YabP/YqfC family sporulation protein [Oscillospiraceae bacterium]
MVQDKAEILPKMPHNISLENRNLLCATGILSIISYDEYAATLDTALGTLVIGGSDIHMSELSVKAGEVKVQGNIEYIQYQNKKDKSTSLFKKLIR